MKSKSTPRFLPLLLAGLLPAAYAAPALAGNDGVLASELAEARKEVQRELAKARTELETGNLEVGRSLRFGSQDRRARNDLPRAEITPEGDFLIEGEAVAINADQRRQLLDYRSQVVQLALAGIELGEVSAQAALEVVDRNMFSLLVGAMTGSLERKIEKTVMASLQPGLESLCRSLPALLDTQDRLAASLPEFRPYATLRAEDVDDCEEEVRREFARR